MVSSSLKKRSVSWGNITIMGSNSVIQIDFIHEGCVQRPLFIKHPESENIQASANANRIEKMILRRRVDSPKLNGSTLLNLPVYSTLKRLNSIRKRLARASLPPFDLIDKARDTYEDVKYDPMDRGCQRTGLRLRRFSRPYWIHSGERNIGIVYGTMTARASQQEAKFERERRKSRYTVNQIVPEVHIVMFSPRAKLEKLRELNAMSAKRETLNRGTQPKKEFN